MEPLRSPIVFGTTSSLFRALPAGPHTSMRPTLLSRSNAALPTYAPAAPPATALAAVKPPPAEAAASPAAVPAPVKEPTAGAAEAAAAEQLPGLPSRTPLASLDVISVSNRPADITAAGPAANPVPAGSSSPAARTAAPAVAPRAVPVDTRLPRQARAVPVAKPSAPPMAQPRAAPWYAAAWSSPGAGTRPARAAAAPPPRGQNANPNVPAAAHAQRRAVPDAGKQSKRASLESAKARACLP